MAKYLFQRYAPRRMPCLVFLLLLSIVACPILAQSAGARGTDEWEFTVAPYLLLPWMNGTVAIQGQEVDVDTSPGDIFDNLQFGAMGYFEARKAQWGVGIDAVYMALGTDIARPSANVDVNQGAFTFLALRQLNEKADLVFGARWSVIDGKIGFKGPQQSTFEQTKQWVDPIVGLKVRQPLVGRFYLSVEADIGGFGAGSDFAWQAFPIVGIDVAKRAAIGVGYRALSLDYATGNENRRFEYDVVTQGMVFGMSFSF